MFRNFQKLFIWGLEGTCLINAEQSWKVGVGGGWGGGKLSKRWHTKAAVLMFTVEFYRQPVHSHRLAFRLQGRGGRRVASVSCRILVLFLHQLYTLSKHSEELIVCIQSHSLTIQVCIDLGIFHGLFAHFNADHLRHILSTTMCLYLRSRRQQHTCNYTQ